MTAAPIYVVVCAYGAPNDMRKEDGTRYGPIVMETDVEGATMELAQARAAKLEKAYGPCRIGRVVFEDDPRFALLDTKEPQRAHLAALSAQEVPQPSIDEAKLLDLLKSAFEDGFTSHATYNDTTLNSPGEEWAKERDHYAAQLRKLTAAPAAPKQAEAQNRLGWNGPMLSDAPAAPQD